MGYKLTSIKCLSCAYSILILSVNFTSAGLLQAIREAAVPKDMDYKLPTPDTSQHSMVLGSASIPSQSILPPPPPPHEPASLSPVTPVQEVSLFSTLQSSLAKLSSAIQGKGDLAPTQHPKCKPGDILCASGFSVGTQMQNNLSKAIIKSFGTMMSDMVNMTISRSLVDFMSKHGPSTGETVAEEHKAMVAMAASVLQTVSSRVIKAFTFFIQLAISGAMQDLLQQLMKGVTTVYQQHQKSMSDMRTAAILNSPPSKIPKPSEPQDDSTLNTDPIKAILNAGALTALSYPGFDLMSSLKSNLFTGDTNSLVKKRGAAVLTPYGFINRKK